MKRETLKEIEKTLIEVQNKPERIESITLKDSKYTIITGIDPRTKLPSILLIKKLK